MTAVASGLLLTFVVSSLLGVSQSQQLFPRLIGGFTTQNPFPPPLKPSTTFGLQNPPSVLSGGFQGGFRSPSPSDVLDLQRLSEVSNLFTWDSYQALQVPYQRNVFYSPYSIMNALGMLTLGSSGNTAAQLREVLRSNFVLGRQLAEPIHRSLSLENQKLTTDKTAIFAVGNRFFVDFGSSGGINPDYQQDLQQYYNSGIQVVNFSSNPSQTRQTINDWVSQSTLGKINNFLQQNLDPLTRLILVNTIYFNGRWALPFNRNLTKLDQFVTPSGAVNVPFMYLQGPLQYARDSELDIETVVLPYQRLNYAMHILLPGPNTDLATVESQLNAGYLQKLSKATRQNPVVLKMPKFSLRESLSLRDMLFRLNVTDVFDPAKGDFSGIFVNNRPGLLVDDVIHEAVVEVDEEGTVAAAATGIIVLRIAQPTQYVTVDRPFLFYISDESNDVILFWGRVVNPSAS